MDNFSSLVYINFEEQVSLLTTLIASENPENSFTMVKVMSEVFYFRNVIHAPGVPLESLQVKDVKHVALTGII